MNVDPASDDFAMKTALTFFRARQTLAAAIIYTEVAQGGASTPGLWCGLGSALMASRGTFVRKPFEAWAAKVFRRGAPSFPGTPYAAAAKDWLAELPGAERVAPLTDEELPRMLEFLVVNEAVLPEATAALPDEDRMGVVMTLCGRAKPVYLPLLRAAIEGRLGHGAARSALKRIGPFLERAELQASLLAAAEAPDREELEPYLGFIVDRLPPEWNQPRTSAAPAYEGIGRVEVELVAAGSSTAACEAALRAALGASSRDARSWAAHAPCVVKRGAMRDDARRLQADLEKAGARVSLHHHDDAPAVDATPAASAKPWWKFW
jgi:hypothetical protein